MIRAVIRAVTRAVTRAVIRDQRGDLRLNHPHRGKGIASPALQQPHLEAYRATFFGGILAVPPIYPCGGLEVTCAALLGLPFGG